MPSLLVDCCTKTYVGFNGSARVRWDKVSIELVMKTNICTETKSLLRGLFLYLLHQEILLKLSRTVI